ncbi:MAG: hypothetical protein R3F20_00630 [Planctomycetota bacterium]
MVEVRVESKEIDFRIAYLGRTGATKFANIRRLHDALRPLGAGDLTVIHAGGDRIVGFHLVDEEESRLFEMRVGFKLVTIPGEIRSRANELLLASSADAVVWIDDRVGEDQGAPTALAEVLGAIADQGVGEAARPVMVQCYSDDGEDRATRYRRSLEGREARIRRIDSDEEGVRGLFEEVKKHVLDTYRELERGQPGRGRRDRTSRPSPAVAASSADATPRSAARSPASTSCVAVAPVDASPHARRNSRSSGRLWPSVSPPSRCSSR